jgi:hypothetical protein
MALEGPRFPQLQYTRIDVDAPKVVHADDTLQRALDLARQLEDLLEETRSVAAPSAVPGEDPRAHSTRMARAFAASLVDELSALVRPVRHTGSS